MKREFKGFLACLAIILLVGAGRKYDQSQRVFQNEGDTLGPISVTCSDSAWTAVSAASSIRRSVLLQTLSTAGASVCISTATAGPCVDTMPGLELEAGANVTDFSEALLNCRSRSGNVQVKGMAYSDSEDTEGL